MAESSGKTGYDTTANAAMTRNGYAWSNLVVEVHAVHVPELLADQQIKLTEATPPRPPSPTRVLLLAVFAGLLWLGSMRWVAGAHAEFYPFELPTLGWYCLAALLVALCLARVTRPNIGLGWGSVLVLVMVPGAILAAILLEEPTWYAAQPLIYAIALGLAALFLFARTRSLCGRIQWRAVVSALALIGGFLWLNHALYLAPTLWYGVDADDVGSNARYDNAALESLLFNQAAKIDTALTQLGPRHPGSNAFFLGFAGYAEEKVFAEEIKFAARVMDQRYGSGQRTLFLLNDARDLVSQPLASTSGLRYAVAGIAKQMHLSEDVLILALSSHGSESAELAVSNNELPMGLLTAGHVRAALDEAAVRWRLLVVSACYAGSFVETLADPNTAIIAAAAPDRTSFGCSNDRELTYFGEAFYRDALPEASNLRSAFDSAVSLVTEREHAIKIEPSNPVAHIGSQIEAKLLELSATQTRQPPLQAAQEAP
ncbi:MAG: C13 family peptidase [Pseudomonadales bacterium]